MDLCVAFCVFVGFLLWLLANSGNSDFCKISKSNHRFYGSRAPFCVCVALSSDPFLERCFQFVCVCLCHFWFSFGAKSYLLTDLVANGQIMQKRVAEDSGFFGKGGWVLITTSVLGVSWVLVPLGA